ncbi:MAG: hypothetical protein LBH34_01780, partial [Prevotellaceae bacterium]|nr:hypothetical protein [Prevotellaceae bacterium]
MKKLLYLLSICILCVACGGGVSTEEPVTIIVPDNAHVRVQYGADKLSDALVAQGYQVQRLKEFSKTGFNIMVGELGDDDTQLAASQVGIVFSKQPGKEGFIIRSKGNAMVIGGTDATGVLYGCVEVCNILKRKKELPQSFNVVDQPEMVLRGTCIGLQKPYYLQGRTVYEYPYTPETFPWFYDKQLWIEYLDMLVDNRMNSLYLWNGHPFASLVKLKDYPYALEVSEETFKKNQDIFGFLTEEANKRGIFVIQMFYNILLSKPFAERHGLKTQDRSRPITPLIADYTRKSVAAFIENYPNVGLLVCLGEAMNTYEDDVDLFINTIIPGVKDGLKKLGRTDEPPILLRAHDTNAKMVMDAALPIYKNLYTMHKYNGESLTTYEPRGPWSQIHKDLSSLGSVHIENVHILANLEPFRWGAPDFVRKVVLAMHKIHGANGLHLYPQASYWDWPYSADNTSPRLKQIDRDWIWYQAWARYAWNSRYKESSEIKYWSQELGDFYGCNNIYGRKIKKAYEESGEIAPKLLRRFGITEGNRQTLLLGMFMAQLVNPYKFRIYPGFYESCGPEGEKLIEYMEKEYNGEPHVGETPVQIISEVVKHGKKAVELIEKAAPNVTKNKAEFERLKNDIYCYNAFANFFAQKVKTGEWVLRYQHTKDISMLDKALPHLEKSVEYYKDLIERTKDTYLYANSMQTKQRRIPIGGDDGKNKTWEEMLPHYERELENFRKNIALLKASKDGNVTKDVPPFTPVNVRLFGGLKQAPLRLGVEIYKDKDYVVKGMADELQNLSFVQMNMESQMANPTKITFESSKPVNVVIGYFNSEKKEYSEVPTLERDASANEYGQAEAKIINAMDINGLPGINIH